MNIRSHEVTSRVVHVCMDCGRGIAVGEYKTEVVFYGGASVFSRYSCCRKPWIFRVVPPRVAFRDWAAA